MATIVGGSGDDSLVGTGADDQIDGLAGNDVLNGGGGTDRLNGGSGNDTFIVDSADDQVIEGIGGGNDAVYAAASYTLNVGSEVEVLSAFGQAGTNAIDLVGNAFAQTIIGNAGSNLLTGGGGADVLYGLGGDDTYLVDSADDQVIDNVGQGIDAIYASANYMLRAGAEVEILSTYGQAGTGAIDLSGNAFAQTIIGNSGNNVLTGGGGADVLYGLGGNDSYFVDIADDLVFENAGQGSDTVFALASYTLVAGSEVEVLSVVDRTAAALIDLTGNAFAQTIIGNAGNNVLNGGGGADIMYGLAGNDLYFVDSADDLVIENADQGSDTVFALGSYTLFPGSEVEVLSVIDRTATIAIKLTGNAIGQTVIGNAGNNVLNGGGGADVLYGLDGNDTYFVDSADDQVVENAGQGIDTVFASTNYTLFGGCEVEVLSVVDRTATAAINLTGNHFAQTIIGNAGNNLLVGGGGADVFYGLGGNDTYFVDSADDQVIENGGQGSDAVYTFADYRLFAGSEVEILSAYGQSGTGALALTGNEFAQSIIGNDGANILDGGAGADLLYGLGGSDTFAFTAALGGGDIDIVADFMPGADRIQLGGAAGEPFEALASGALAGGGFVIGTAALQADDYIIYNSATGALSYDADGNGAGAAIQFAVLSLGLNLTVGDFIVSGPANNPPVISSGTAASIAENSPTSTIVYQAQASDADGDRINWTLTGTDADKFTIDANGAVRLINPADYETKATYGLTIVASDSGTSTSQILTVNVTDINESGPSTPIFNETAAPNDNQGSAQSIDRNLFAVASNPNLPNAGLPSGTILGRVNSFTDGDYYSITLQAGEKIILDVDGTTEGLDSQIFLYNSSGTLLISNDDKGTPDPGSGIQFGHNTDSYLDFRVATSGTYYFKVAAFSGSGQQSLGNYQLNVSIGPVATPAQIAQETADKNIDALISGDMWDHLNLTYGFPTSASQYPTQFDELDTFQAFNSNQIGATQQLLTMIASVSQLTFAPNSFQPGQANLRYAMSDDPDVAYAFYPTNDGPNSVGGTAWFGTSVSSWLNPVRGNYAWMGILHETGHALGLKHGHEDPAITADRDSVEFSVMTYRSYVGGDLEGYSNEKFGYPQTLMQYDIGALQRTYGANFNFNAGDSTYSWNPGTGEMSINGAPMGAPGDGSAQGNRVFMTIWDGGGNDTYNLSNYANGTTIDLRPGEWSKTSQVQLADLGDGRDARGNIANALLYNGNNASLIENAVAGPGNDVLVANQAANELTGGTGGDIFRWMTIDDARVGALADTITDFLRGTDKIDFAQIDALPTTLPRDAFTFIGTAAFHNVVGEVRYDVIGGNAHIFADADGNGVADMEIIVSNNTILTGSDFNF